MRKYRNVKTVVDGITFDSKAEAKRYGDLKLLLRDKRISGLELQRKFVVLDAIPGQRAITYKVDFLYVEKEKLVAEDVKGKMTQQGKLRIKMFRVRYPEIELRIIK